MLDGSITASEAIPVSVVRWPRHVWKKIKQTAMRNARLAGLSKAEWERRRMAYPRGPKAADLAMYFLLIDDGARCYLDCPALGGGHILDGLV